MLTIHNNPDGTAAKNNYRESRYNAEGLVYLSRHSRALRLFIPTAASAWVSEMKAARRATITPSERKGCKDHLDIRFDNGTPSPFSICIQKDFQTDGIPNNGQTKLLVYADPLDKPLNIPCRVVMPAVQRAPFFTAAEVCGHFPIPAYRMDMYDAVVAAMKGMLSDLENGGSCDLEGTEFAVHCLWHSPDSISLTVHRNNSHFMISDVVKISICRHNQRGPACWSSLGGEGPAPTAPFCATSIVTKHIRPEDIAALPLLTKKIRHLAWAWLETD